MPTLTADQLWALAVTERVTSAISIVGILFIVSTYLLAPGFNKPINRLIFFACFGNLGSNTAALISEIGPHAGARTAVCDFQAFLVQMFLGVDCYWAFCMAINVYLVFFRGYTVEKLRSLDPFYLLACYGLSFIPAFAFLFITTHERGPMYGPAIIWCWITTEWDFMRMVFLYGIVWAAIILALYIYSRAAKVVWDKRESLEGFMNPLNENPLFSAIVIEVEVTSEERPIVNKETATNVRVRSRPAALRMRNLTRQVAQNEADPEAWLYARVAFLFFIALLITWVPSSANRIYALVNPNSVNFGLNYAASFVFPLQAFWNTVVYIISSQTACRELWQTITLRAITNPPLRRHNTDSQNTPKKIQWANQRDSVQSSGSIQVASRRNCRI
ncbi:hypothetical protein BGW36DRAFT_448258 [Talaromyces proteolyticus]|uniref:G-protein coupled receptors family 2 profile 2 domain-containing protein n=1 Tax=Talaromyces proteolyticus TaxID=1131652 RepID=A0AAD4KQN6_9EURO|nr:uncharacterized protein BGW36DRAFT_448258 [Talaromyces proteolyticus]KAH8698345.1 hypothetical protein BGW36DRAFT_448258 [Talaromyces proteolyticus]